MNTHRNDLMGHHAYPYKGLHERVLCRYVHLTVTTNKRHLSGDALCYISGKSNTAIKIKTRIIR
jgi:hypothetical protein